MIKVFDTFADEVVSAWRRLEDFSDVSVFQSLVWCQSAWETLLAPTGKNRLYLMLWTGAGNESPVVMPTFLDRGGTLRFINDSNSDHGDAIYEHGVNRHYAFKEIVEAIKADCGISSVCLQKFQRESEALGYLGVFLGDSLIYRDHAYSCLDIPHAQDLASGQKHLCHDDRNRIASCQRKVASIPVAICSARAGLPFPEAQLVALRDAMMKNGWRRAEFLDANMMRFMRSIYERGICDVISMGDGDVPIAMAVRLRQRGKVHCWLMLYQNPKWNTYLNVRYFGHLAQEGDFMVDLGVGIYEYKMKPFRPKLECTFSLRWGRGLFAQIYAFLRMNWRFIRVAWGCHRR